MLQNTKMRVAVIGTYPPQKDGIGIYSSRLVEKMQQMGKEVKVFSFKGNGDEEKNVLGCLGKHNPFSYFAAAKKVHQFGPDKVIIHFEYVHFNLLFFPILLFMLKFFGYKVNLVMHTVAPYDRGWKAMVFKMIHLSLFLLTDKVFVHTTLAKEKLAKRSWTTPSISVVPLAIPDFPKTGKADKDGLLLFGFISEDKGIDIACKAVEGLDVKLTIAGTVNPYAMKKQYKYLEGVKRLCGKNITLINRYVDEKEKQRLFQNSAIILLPYRSIEQSAVLTEVWAYGKIPICSDIPSFKEEVDDRYGVLFKEGSAGNLRDKIDSLLHDNKKQHILLANIRKLAKKRSLSSCSRELIEKMA